MRPIYLLKAAIVSCLLVNASACEAQMIGTDVFMKGKYLEVGVGDLGFYGTAAPTPAGYHSYRPGATTLNSLGFVADPVMDGWTTGYPEFIGDYFTPGTPFEGWEIQVGGKRALAYNTGGLGTFSYDGGMGTCTGANVSHALSGSVLTATWQGLVDSIDVKQITTFDTNDLFFNIKIIFTNTATAPKNNIYYLRTLDPDNDAHWPTGGFTTDNFIEHQVRDTTVVSALGASCSYSYMALGTTDTASTAIMYNAWPILATEDLANVYNGITTSGTMYTAQGTKMNADWAIGVVTYIPHLATVDSAGDSVARTTSEKHLANTATINLFYAFSPAAVDSAIKAGKHTNTGTTTPILGINNAATANSVSVYPNPAGDNISITGLKLNDRISICDMMGRAGNNWQADKDGTSTFSMHSVPAGSYILVVKDDNNEIKARVPVRKL